MSLALQSSIYHWHSVCSGIYIYRPSVGSLGPWPCSLSLALCLQWYTSTDLLEVLHELGLAVLHLSLALCLQWYISTDLLEVLHELGLAVLHLSLALCLQWYTSTDLLKVLHELGLAVLHLSLALCLQWYIYLPTFWRFSMSLALQSSISRTRRSKALSQASHCSRMSRAVSCRMLSLSVLIWIDAIRSCSERVTLSWLNCAQDSPVDWLHRPNSVNVKSFPSHEAHRAALISVSSALSQTPVYTARPRIRG